MSGARYITEESLAPGAVERTFTAGSIIDDIRDTGDMHFLAWAVAGVHKCWWEWRSVAEARQDYDKRKDEVHLVRAGRLVKAGVTP